VVERDLPRGWLAGLGVAAALFCISIVVVTRRQPESTTPIPLTDRRAVELPTSSSSVDLTADATEATAPATTEVTAPATTPATPAAVDRTAPFTGMGAWVDVFEWAPSYLPPGGASVKLPPAAVDRMAAEGVQVLYLQATRYNNPTGGDIVDPDVLGQWLARAKANGIRVVAWYMPTFTDPVADLRRLKAVADAELTGHLGDKDLDAVVATLRLACGVPIAVPVAVSRESLSVAARAIPKSVTIALCDWPSSRMLSGLMSR